MASAELIGTSSVLGAASAGRVLGFSNEPLISWRARARGLHSVDQLKATVLRQRSTWWQGRTFHCALCDLDFLDATGAAEHVVVQQHPVLRMD